MRPGTKRLSQLLQKSRTDSYPLVFVVPGSGQVARYAIEGGAQFLMVLNAGTYRTAGVSSLCAFLPYGNANDQTEELLISQIMPRSSSVPLVAGVMATDPVVPLAKRFDRLTQLGVEGVTNWPAVGLVDGSFRQMLTESGFTVDAEVEMLHRAKQRGFVTFGFALNSEEAARMAQTGADAMVLNVGWTHESQDIYEKSDRIEYAAVKINSMLKAIWESGADPVCLFFGGAVLLPEDSSLLYQRTNVHGFGGGSSFERIPVAKVIISNVRKFRSVPKSRDHGNRPAGLGKMVGASPVMNKMYRLIERVAPFDVNVCIEGESGVGKELIANQIHRLSTRNSQPFITLNCGAIPDTLLESEFFGHEKGSFTGAINRRLGKFELADRGTLFLDEVAELSPKAQVSLLRVLQQKEITRVGGEKAISVDPRIITATHQNLNNLVNNGKFRDDLYYRLAMISLQAPPLRVRLQDIPALVDYFLSELGTEYNREIIGVSRSFMSRLTQHTWPGNVRELKHVLARAILLEDGPILQGDDFIPEMELHQLKLPEKPLLNVVQLSTDNTNHQLIIKALAVTGGNKSKAARLLGISRKTLYARIKKTEGNLST
jgi:DNA-binding NtrC family response regulator/predicted TIM-barrel enzyme